MGLLVFHRSFPSENFISVFKVENSSAWRKRKMAIEKHSLSRLSNEGNGEREGATSQVVLFTEIWFSRPGPTED